MKWHRRFLVVGLTLALLGGVSCTITDNSPIEAPAAPPVAQPFHLDGVLEDLDDLAGDLTGGLTDDLLDRGGDALGGLTRGLGTTLGGANETVSDITNLLSCSRQKYVAVQETIGPNGGRIRVGEHTLDIPAGALTRKVRIKAEQMRGSTNSVRFSPEGLRFEKPAELTMSYRNCKVVLLPKTIVYTTEKFKILEVLQSLDLFRKRTVKADIDHFSRYAVAY
jgi:hypothetical protein